MGLANLSQSESFLDTFWNGKRVMPRFLEARASFPASEIHNLEKETANVVAQSGYLNSINPGSDIAIAVGSRGIAGLAVMVRILVEKIRAAGGNPFIVPAMGSHGQSTGEGQEEVLHSLEITSESVLAPIRSSMNVKHLGKTAHQVPVYIDEQAFCADGIIVINRVREHTDFEGPIQSGLMKMLAIGLGKAYGATAIHERGAGELHVHIPEVARQIIQSAPIALGIGVVENGNGEIATIRAARPDQFENVDKELLTLAVKATPRLPVDHLDILVVRQIGKDISGTGMDTKTVGRIRIPGIPEPLRPIISRIVALDLTEASHGNATGLYLADITTKRLVSKIDYRSFYLNQLASAHLEGGKIPLALSSEREAIEVAMCIGRGYNSRKLRAMLIQDTKHLASFWVSESLIPEIEHCENIMLSSRPFNLAFDPQGNLLS
jgi:hypothetical protein